MNRSPHLRSALPLACGVALAYVSGLAAPAGLSVQSGTASLSTQGPQLEITASHNAVLQWQSFNIAANESARFLQPSPSAVVWNHILDSSPSQIFGRLEANGVVVLVNQAGFAFGPDAFVRAAGLIVSTAPAAPSESGSGLFWQFSGAPPEARIVNHGHLETPRGGCLFLIAEQVENRGSLLAPEGQIGLLAGQDVLISSRPDGRGLNTAVTLPAGAVDNAGRIVADAGSIALHARVVNQNGVVQADSVRERNGVIELFASHTVNLGPQSYLSAQGGSNPEGSHGGAILVKSEGTFTDNQGSRLDVQGGSDGGDGGFVEISAPILPAIHSTLDARAAAGHSGGRLLIDPQDIVLGASGDSSAGTGTVAAGDPPALGTLRLDVNAAFLGFSEITLQATRDISIATGTVWDLESSTGLAEPGSRLTLEAGRHLTVANGANLLAGPNWSVTLVAGRDFAAPAGTVTPGLGNITFAGTGTLQTRNGDIHLRAGNNVTVGHGSVRTVAGGSILVEAVAGTMDSGAKANGFRFLPTGYAVDPDLGGVSTANGGNVTLVAGLDVLSYLPVPGGNQGNAGSGAFGAAPGHVTIQAGRDVAGHFVVRHGHGTIAAGRNAGTASRLLALSVVDGGWTVHAGQDVLLQEVRNPNGLFNNLGSANSVHRHRFDYSPDAYTHLHAGHSVQLRGTALPRFNNAFSQGMPPIYPGTLVITAGPGGVRLGNDVILFPSPIGNLSVTTTGGGSLVGEKPGDLAQLILSDSGRIQYRSYGDFGLADHAATPVHLDSPEPLRLSIDGNLRGVLIGSPKRAEITVGGDMINSRFDGQHLQAGDVTRLHVQGDILNRNEFTSVTSATPPNSTLFDPILDLIYPPLTGGAAGVESRFFYDAAAQRLTFQGRMTGEQLQALLNLQVRVFDGFGLPQFLPNGEPATRTAEFLPPDLLRQLFALSQDVPLNPDSGYRLGGGGTFELRARNLDLGATVGIVSQGPRANPALAALFTTGADLHLNLAGNLDMFSSKIATLNGGAIDIVAGGTLNLGSRTFTVSDAAARGIFTVDPSHVTIVARGDINVNGSRIAAYDGGHVLVRSLEGNIDAGTGGGGAATVEKIYVDPVTRRISSYSPTIPGSGILATTFPPSLGGSIPPSTHPVGDIVVQTPRGDIVASAGGIAQISLNGAGSTRGTVTLAAGTKDEAGRVVHVGHIDASGSGIIGSNVRLEASGDIRGLVFARDRLDISANQNVIVTALAVGNANINAGEAVSGTIIGLGSLAASGSSVDASLLSQNVTTSGDLSSAQVGFTQANTAANTSQALQHEEPTKSVSAHRAGQSDEEESNRKLAAAPKLTRRVGRVTVILPP